MLMQADLSRAGWREIWLWILSIDSSRISL
jgi:hypothetical protein